MAQKNNEKVISLPEKDEKLAEIVGIILGDGGIYKNIGLGMYELRIAGSSDTDNEYLMTYVKPLIEKAFNVNVRVYRQKKKRCIHLIAQGKNIVSFLEKIGLKEGNKIKNNVSIPEWVFESESLLKSCIRGLIDTDGTVLPITGRNYSYIWFSCGIPALREDFDKAMKALKYRTSQWNFRPNRTPEKYIGDKPSIFKYSQEIGFNNPKHIKRFNVPQGYASLV